MANAVPSPATSANPPANRAANPTDNGVERTRAWTGLWVVVGGDAAIAAAAVYGVIETAGSTGGSPAVAILTSAFTAIGTMTTAYFGIKTMSNTAQSFRTAARGAAVPPSAADPGTTQAQDQPPPPGPPTPADPANPTNQEIVDRTQEPPTAG